jgi:hypothetical protein
MVKYARIFLNGRTRALSDVVDGRIGPSVAVTTLVCTGGPVSSARYRSTWLSGELGRALSGYQGAQGGT